jgi:NADH-quinone oxidoreductase subunit J
LFTRYAYPAQLAAVHSAGGERRGHRPDAAPRKGGKPQDIAKQVAVRAKDRVRIVKMASEKRP